MGNLVRNPVRMLSVGIRSVEYFFLDREYSISQSFYTQLIEYLPLTEYSIHQVTSSDQ